MADHSAGDDETDVERQLELHLEEQRDSLSTVKEALATDPANPELIGEGEVRGFTVTVKCEGLQLRCIYLARCRRIGHVLEELQMAIKDAEDGLLHLKRSRLLKEADAIFGQEFESLEEDVKVEPLDSKHSFLEPSESGTYSIGSKCRFRHSDGRWYNGHIVALDGGNAARISFLNPTSESMLMCKFFLRQRCRFGSNCRMSHGFNIPFSWLKPYIPVSWCESLVGSNIWAISEGHSNIWRRAELEAWDDKLGLGRVIFQDDGSSASLGREALSLSEYADATSSSGDDDDEDSLRNESSSSSDEDNFVNRSVHQGIGFLESSASLRGIQTETAVFAKWEHHTRGIASKMMANMGYRKGMGLGATGQGTLDPISVRVLPSRQSLDHALASNENEENSVGRGRKRSRGGRKKQEQKLAEAERVAKAEEEEETDVFSFINNHLTGLNAASSNVGSKVKRGVGDSEGKVKVEDRRSLVAYEDEVKELRIRVEKIEEMVNRNRKDKTVFEAASRKLVEMRKALADAEAAHVSASNAVMSKEKEKRWLKF